MLPLAAIIMLGAASWLRIFDLDRIPPGVWVDEAIEGLQAHALIHGEALPDLPGIPNPRWPVWRAIEAASIGLFGCSPVTIRLPAALFGVLAVGLAGLAGRTLAGTAGGLAAAGFLAGSFWHIEFSRMALPCAMAVLEGLVIGSLLLRPHPLTWTAVGIIFLAMTSAVLGYAAGLVAIPLVGMLLVLRLFGRTTSPTERPAAAALATGFLVLCAVIWRYKPESVLRSTSMGLMPVAAIAAQVTTCLSNWIVTVPAAGGYWLNFPAGAARFSPIEAGFLILGFVALIRSDHLLRWQKVGIAGWLVVASLPEMLPGGGIHVIRALPLLAPAVILAALAGRWISERAGVPGRMAMIVLFSVNGFWTARIVAGPFAHSSVTATWYGRTDLEAAGALRELAAREPIVLAHEPGYAEDPVLRFHLINEIASGAIRGIERDLDAPRLVRLFREPMADQPVLCLLESRSRHEGRRHLGLVNLHGLVAPAMQMLNAGRPQDALRHLKIVLGWAPDSATVRGKLGLVEVALGHRGRAREHLNYALRFIPNDREYRAALAGLRP